MTEPAPLTVRLFRHGEVTSHRGDIPVTAPGLERARQVGEELSATLPTGERLAVLHASTLRARQTAEALYEGMLGAMGEGLFRGVLPPSEEPALRNPDLYVAGVRVEMVSSPEALAEQLVGTRLGAAEVAEHGFFREFWSSTDRIGLWLTHRNPPGEDIVAVARRLMAFLASLLDLSYEGPETYICVTHSPLLRALLQHYLSMDHGEPEYLEAIDVRASATGIEVGFRDHRKVLARDDQ